MSNSQQHKWNARYRLRQGPPPEAEAFLRDKLGLLRPGRVLDFACGDGRHALLLAGLGHEVWGVDFASQGLSRMQHYARQQGLQLHSIQADLSQPAEVATLGQYHNLLVFRYKPEPEIMALLPDLLLPGGRLFFATYNLLHAQRTGFPARFCLQQGELLQLWPNMKLLKYETFEEESSDGYVFEKI
ncbi:MAG: class I SAM-dependent methyltransferase [Bacteroidetes bacterium]|nr:MAG: class I SAM-dependent methyltransferase [Bacteroidota bacterium]